MKCKERWRRTWYIYRIEWISRNRIYKRHGRESRTWPIQKGIHSIGPVILILVAVYCNTFPWQRWRWNQRKPKEISKRRDEKKRKRNRKKNKKRKEKEKEKENNRCERCHHIHPLWLSVLSTRAASFLYRTKIRILLVRDLWYLESKERRMPSLSRWSTTSTI